MKSKRDNIIAAPLIGGVVGVLTFFLLYSLVGLKDMAGDILGMNLGFFLSLIMAVVVAAILFGELLADTLAK